MIYQIYKIVGITVICGFLAACQTSGLKHGAIQSSFAPQGWTKTHERGFTFYQCARNVCGSKQAVAVGPVRVTGNIEEAIRSGELDAKLMNAIANVYNVASDGREKYKITRRIVKKDYSGFDVSARFRTSKGTVYAYARAFTQANRGSMVASFAYSSGKARSNFNAYLARTKVRRVQ